MIGGLTACNEEEVRGVFVAKFLDGSGRFVKRIAISIIDGPALSLALVTKSKRYELIAPVLAGALSGIALLHCEGESKFPSRWQMTSCHSGYVRSEAGLSRLSCLVLAENAYTAQNQLELAMRAHFELPVNDCPSGFESSPHGDCYATNTLSLPPLPETPESKLP